MWWLILCVSLTGQGITQIKHYYWGGCECVSRWDEHLNWFWTVDGPPQQRWAPSIPLRAWTEKRWERRNLPLVFLYCDWTGTSHLISPVLGIRVTPFHWFLCFSDLWFHSELCHCFPGSPACRWQMIWLLSHCHHISQFLIINLSLYSYI